MLMPPALNMCGRARVCDTLYVHTRIYNRTHNLLIFFTMNMVSRVLELRYNCLSKIKAGLKYKRALSVSVLWNYWRSKVIYMKAHSCTIFTVGTWRQ